MRTVNCIINTSVTSAANVGTAEPQPGGRINMSETVNVSGEVSIEVIHNGEATIISNSNLVVNLGIDALVYIFAGNVDNVYRQLNYIKLGSGTTPPTANDIDIEVVEIVDIYGSGTLPAGEVQNFLQITAEKVSETAFS